MMGMSRKEKASLNIISSAVLDLISVINGFILPRLILQNYGSAYNGIVSSATQFLSLISILTIGIGASTRVALYRALADQDVKATSSIIRATENYMRRVGTILAVYILGLALVYPFVVKTGFSFWEVSSLIIIVGLSSFAEYYFGITYRTLLLADQCVFISNIFSILATILNLVLTVILIRAGFSFQMVKLGSAVVFVLKPLLQNIYVSKRYRIDKHCEPDMNALKNRRDTMMHTVANIVHNNTDLVVLTLLTDVKTVSVYTVYNLVLGAISKTQSIFTSGTEPIFGSMWARGEAEGISRNLSIHECFISMFSAIAYSVTAVMILPFVAIYTRNVNDVEYIRPIYAEVIILAFVILAFRTPYLALVQGIGHYRQTRSAAIWEAAINLSVSIILVLAIPSQKYKMVGVALGTLVANLFRTIHYAIYIDNHVVQRGKHVFALRILWTLANIILISTTADTFISRFSIDTWKAWVLCAACVGLFSTVFTIASAVIFYRRDMKNTMRVFISMIRKRLPKKN